MDFRTWDSLDRSTFGPFGEVCWAQPEVTKTEVILQTSKCCQAMLAHFFEPSGGKAMKCLLPCLQVMTKAWPDRTHCRNTKQKASLGFQCFFMFFPFFSYPFPISSYLSSYLS